MSTLEILLLILIVLGAAGLALWQYNPIRKQPSWQLLAVLRFVAYVGVGLLLMNIKITHRETRLEKPALAVAVDNSKSIEVLKGGSKVHQWIEELTGNQELEDKFDISFYSFGRAFRVMDSLDFSEEQTDISQVFSNFDNLYHKNRARTVLITDGNQTLGRDYGQVAQYHDFPLSTVVVGDTATYADLDIRRVNVNRYSFLENTFPVEVFVNYTGNQSVTKKMSIREGNTLLFQKELEFSPDQNAVVAVAQLKAQSIGVHTYTIEVEPLKEEKNTDNNEQSFAVEVIDQQTKVLILSSFLHPDLGGFKKSIESNKQQVADIEIIAKDNDAVQWEDYQLVLLYQPTSAFRSVYDQIAKIGLNTFTITGTQTDYNFLNRHQDDFKKESSGAREYYMPRYNAGYEKFQVEDIGFADFPPLQDRFGDLALTSDYDPLFFQTINDVELDIPLLLTVEQEEQRRAYLFGENSWQWRAQSYRDRDSFEDYDAFIGQIVQYLASDKKRERLEVDYNTFYNTGDRIVFQAHYFDENYQFDPRAHLEARVVNKDSETAQTYPLILKNDRYELDLSGLKAGDYTFTIHVEGHNLSKSGAFTLVAYDPEKQFKSANYKTLQEIATRSSYLIDESPDALIDELLSDKDYKPLQKSKITKSSLIDWKYLFFIILAVLTLEWFIRKYRGLI